MGAPERGAVALRPGNNVTADYKISMRSESVRTGRRQCEVVHCAQPVNNTAQLELDTVADKPPVPPRRPGQQNDSSPQEAVRAHWREVVRRARPVDNTARLDLDVHETARLDPGIDSTARLAPDRAAVERGGEVVRGARPVDSIARLRRGVVKSPVPPPPPTTG